MLELVRLIIDTAGKLLPFRIVFEWERACVYWCGKFWYTTGPGLKLLIPGLMDVKPLSVVQDPITTPRLDVTLRGGKHLSYSATISIEVIDPNLAWNTVNRYAETALERTCGIISQGLRDAKPERFDPERGKFDRLTEELREEVNELLKTFGLNAVAIQFPNFVLGARIYRLVTDKSILGEGNHFLP